ncbi:hypothetical protein ABW19_dt0208155 [Dactylella cylindrospora]|nr:hypothetical protein ABW19_dt0208155 [Dactylella cylindrospora]
MQLQLASVALFALSATAVPTGGFVPTIGPFSLKVNSANSELNQKFLGPVFDPEDTTRAGISISETPDRSFYWVPNSANPVPPGPKLAQGTLLYEAKFHTAAYNLTLGLAPFNQSDLYTPVVMRDGSDNSTLYAHAAAYSNSGVIFVNDISEFLGCRADAPTDDSYTLKWQTNFEPGRQGQIDHKCSTVIVSIV